MLSVQSLKPEKGLWGQHEYSTTFDSQLIAGKPQVSVIDAKRAEFTTEALMPGDYQIKVVAYKAMTPEEMRLSGIRAPNYTANQKVTVRKSSAPDMVVIELKATK